jgi:DNA-binding XRE family transcriptional regulator
MAAATKILGSMSRPRETEPDPKTAEGLFALYLAHLIEKSGTTAGKLAETVNVNRSTVFAWLRSDAAPQIRLWPDIAKALKLKSWRALVPPESFKG